MKRIILWISDPLRRVNRRFLALILILQGVGLSALYSATHGAYSLNSSLFHRQILWLVLGWGIFFALHSLNYHFLKRAVWPLYLSHTALLAFILFVGEDSSGVSRWIHVGGFNYQPSEFLKFILVLLLAYQLSRRGFKKPLAVIPVLGYGILCFIPTALVMAQPDLGTAGLSALILSSLALFNGVEKKTLMGLLAVLCVSAPLAWKFVLKPYQKNRIVSFIHPERDPRGSGYNIIQSKIAIGSGRVLGKGFLKGTQHQLEFLPERHTDFIFSVLSEERGFLGSAGLLVLFFFLIALILREAALARDGFGCLLCLGAGMFVFWHVFLNLSMTMGWFPIVGAPLPLLSYGGSHTLTAMAFLGLVSSVNRRKDLF